VKHDLFGKPVSTFPDHALERRCPARPAGATRALEKVAGIGGRMMRIIPAPFEGDEAAPTAPSCRSMCECPDPRDRALAGRKCRFLNPV
jgi:hypothetical protein